MELDFERCYRAVDSRDRRFDGWFVTAVTSTGIYCRPSCPALTPKPENVRFLRTSAAAQRAGFRACLRCRPDAAPGSPDWDTRADVTARAMRLIGDGIVDREGVPGLARRLGYTERHLHRMFVTELGVGPLALARAQRAQTARTLIETTDLTITEIAFAAGFGSVRQFNETIQAVYGRSPSKLRTPARIHGPQPPTGQATADQPAATQATADQPAATQATAGQATAGQAIAGIDHARPLEDGCTVTLRLPYRTPLYAPALLEFLGARAVPGVEEVGGFGYRRALALPHGTARVTLTPVADWIQAELRLRDVRDVAPAVARCRRLLDLDADPVAVDDVLSSDPALAASVRKEPGVRLPRVVDGFEAAVRAIVGQQISVAAARRVLARLAPAQATLVAFPTAEELLELPDEAFRMPAARRAALRSLATAVASGELDLDGGAAREDTLARLCALPGIGPWTAGYVAVRALGDPDVLLHTDLGVRRGAEAAGLPTSPAALAAHAERWRPWRSYAMIRLWRLA